MMDVYPGGGAAYVGGLSQAIPTAAPQPKMSLRFISKSTDLIDVGRLPLTSSRPAPVVGLGAGAVQKRRISTANPTQGLRRMQQQQHGFHPMLQVAGKTLNIVDPR